ncbi:cytochrome b5 reductase 4-like [Macrosteles quadrilineatus]|uniref:cytochrome b5 reductase 4-like n=1 Tax=Macrosteles quadrilineatus TaxID=74068 RepID=UPI0023E24413|nr:cytochrome b5 reductase 4-like [Macrosteles quadrilineatus]
MTSGSATGNPRNKVALKPGHSLMDWIRLGNSGKDLTGTGGAYLSVTKAQLAQHNKPDDAWLSIRGKVYNVTSYMDFHPGGPEELMKGVGTDATKIFNDVHAWVNYESILQKCVVGQLKPACDEDIDITASLSPPGTPTNQLQVKSAASLPNGTAQNRPFQMDWFQQVGSICLVFYTKVPSPDVHIQLEGDSLLCLRINNKNQHLRLESSVSWPCGVTTDAAGKVQLRLKKLKPGLWSRFGSFEPSTKDIAEFWEASVINIVTVTHNTYQIDFAYTENVYNHIPVGHHVTVKAVVNEGEEAVLRPYTPVTSLAGINIPPVNTVRLLVKRYSEGRLSAWLTSRPLGARVSLSIPQGSFSLTPLRGKTDLVLVAAGTGITPMVSLITWALRSTRLKVCLIFFNKTEKDIIWREHLDKLAEENSRFIVDYVLSEPDTKWTNKTGHVSISLLQPHLPACSADIPNSTYVCVCGPTSFTRLTERCLKEDFGFTVNDYYCFLGQ